MATTVSPPDPELSTAESDREREQSLDATASTPAQQESPQSATSASEQIPDRDRPEQSHPTTASTPAQQESQSATPASEPLPDYDRHPTATEDQSDRPEQSQPLTVSTPAQQESPPQSAMPEFPEWMTAKQAFQALGGDPGDHNSSVSSRDGLKQIKFSTFKKKTSSELKSFRLELSQDRKRRRQPCYRLLKRLSK
ncbi:MAG: hypothetical protein EBE86_020625 [Hormoscilla sp. GUM202]|nr:hypothetical protein [Hormoscilla sp. GUM202]